MDVSRSLIIVDWSHVGCFSPRHQRQAMGKWTTIVRPAGNSQGFLKCSLMFDAPWWFHPIFRSLRCVHLSSTDTFKGTMAVNFSSESHLVTIDCQRYTYLASKPTQSFDSIHPITLPMHCVDFQLDLPSANICPNVFSRSA